LHTKFRFTPEGEDKSLKSSITVSLFRNITTSSSSLTLKPIKKRSSHTT